MSAPGGKAPVAPSPGAPYTGPQPSGDGYGTFKNYATSQAEEDAFDFTRFRGNIKPSGVIGSVAHLIKGALGGGILAGHEAFKKGGLALSVVLTFFFGLYIGYSLYVLVNCAFVLYARTRVPSMSYADVGEAAMSCFPSPKVKRWAKPFRYFIDFTICLDLFGACACYQLIMAHSTKQLIENSALQQNEGMSAGYPHIRVYIAAILPIVVLICFIRHLKYLAPLSIFANIIIAVCIAYTVYEWSHLNPGFENLRLTNQPYSTIEYLGMTVFSMSCAGVVIPISNNMINPNQFGYVIVAGMFFIMLFVLTISVFGYAAYQDNSKAPITGNFAMEPFPMCLKGSIAIMILVTHALNFWVPFNLVFFYIKRKVNQDKIVMWELFYRAVFVLLIGLTAITFPNIGSLMGFLGAFCLSLMAFIWPNFIEMLVIYERPGYGAYKWRLWKSIILMIIGFFLLFVGSIVNLNSLFRFA